MNNFKIYIFILGTIVLGASCTEREFVEYPLAGDDLSIVDPYIQLVTAVVPFQAGVESYDVAFNVINGTKNLSKVDVYKQFTNAGTMESSDRVLFKSFDVGDLKTAITEVIDYGQLKQDLTVGGSPLPDDETLLAIGSGWVLSFVGTLTDGGTMDLAGAINVGVLSPYAGLYEVVESDYYRINVQSGGADWTGGLRFIGSVNDTTFSYNDFWARFAWTGFSFNFSVNAETNEITVPILVNEALFSGARELGCHTEPELFVDVPCEGSNILIKDPDNPNGANGKHEIIITYGYYTENSGENNGSRQFYEKLRKK